ncbi:hypothetical protein BN59_03033 [Legionella massiliensis]|uniref:Uncharacterized protein n=1 Tax=Legionella massiliensis TaxID=1034943 RepID=A0A078L0N3_9GAMM|nr:hypothetical protein [Legionella massiliensis]CDZ78721.1 hypothetical protein BN59_03033 [Legionella massiliensis]CEE14459.1 hypothetical protein BN1094_03033 [Legionella massiliensis]
MSNKAIQPEDIIADGADYILIQGQKIRKGSVAAFLANIAMLENPKSTAEERADALQAMKELAPSLVTVGLHHHVNFKNEVAEEIIQQAAEG